MDPPIESVDRNRGGTSPWAERFDELQEYPGQWALVKTCPTRQSAAVTASQLNTGKYRGAEAGDVDAVYDDDGNVYARWVGR